ncbi:MAG: putative Ig domain-containing protein, partial [Rhodobiaceae bacterium]|nr:putative Ig domain-containing protein [Rhodobiaceae bacterium]
LVVIDPATGEFVESYGDGLTQAMVIDPETGRIYVSSGDGIELFDPVAGTFKHFSDYRVGDLAIAPDGTLWGTGWPDRGTVLRFDAKGEAVAVLSLAAPLDSLAFGAEGTAVEGLAFISANIDNSNGSAALLLLDVATEEWLVLGVSQERGDNIIATPDGRILAVQGAGVDVINPVTAPSVLSITPGSNAIATTPVSEIAVVFDADMAETAADADNSVLNPANYVLSTTSGAPVTINAVTYDTATRTATLSFDSLTTENYRLRVIDTIESASGLALGAPVETQFTVLLDFSALIDLQFSGTRSNRGDGTVSYDVTVTNTSSEALLVPLRLVLDPALFFSGVPEGASAAGDLWVIDLSDAVGEDGILGAGETLPAFTTTIMRSTAAHVEIGHGVYALPPENTPPEFIGEPPNTAVIGEAYAYTIEVEDPDDTIFGFLLLQGPDGLTVDPDTGAVSFTPTAASPAMADVRVRIFDMRGAFADAEWTINVADANTAPVFFDPPDFIFGIEGQPLAETFIAYDDDGDAVTLSVRDLPPGADFDPATNTLSWTPGFDKAGLYQIIVQAYDGAMVTEAKVIVAIAQADAPPSLRPVAGRTVREGEAVRFTLQADDLDTENLLYSSPFLPAGATIDLHTGVFEWTPDYTQEGVYTIPLRVTDGTSMAETSVTITVLNRNGAPDFREYGSFEVPEGQNFGLVFYALDPDNPLYAPPVRVNGELVYQDEIGLTPTVTYTIQGLPEGASFDAETGRFLWTPGLDQSGEYAITVTATDDGNRTGTPLSTTVVVPIRVINQNVAPELVPIENQSVDAGDTLVIPVTATDADGSPITLTARLVPAASADQVGISVVAVDLNATDGFARFVDNGDGTGTLTVNPDALDRGDYSIIIDATDDGGGVAA